MVPNVQTSGASNKDAYAGKAGHYAIGRPPYADAPLISAMAAMGMGPDWVVGDIGSGTGNLARHFLGKVRTIYGVEPSPDMLVEQERIFAGQSSFTSVQGTSDETGIPDASLDLIVVGQAFHWFPADTPQEFMRILNPEGWILTAWNDFGGTTEPDLDPYLHKNGRVRLREPAEHLEDWETAFAGALSASFSPGTNEPGFGEFERAQKVAFDRVASNGQLSLKYNTVVIFGRPTWGAQQDRSP